MIAQASMTVPDQFVHFFIPLFHDVEICINCKSSKIKLKLTFSFAKLAWISRQTTESLGRQSQPHSMGKILKIHFLFHSIPLLLPFLLMYSFFFHNITHHFNYRTLFSLPTSLFSTRTQAIMGWTFIMACPYTLLQLLDIHAWVLV